MIRAWKKIGKPKIVIKKSRLHLSVQKFEDPYSKTIVEYSQFGGPPFACIVLAVTPENKVLIIRQYRHGANKILLELPGGIPNSNDQPAEEVAKNELFEESMGYAPERIIKLNSEPLWFDPASFTVPFHAFLALGCIQTGKEVILDQGEYVELIKIPLEEWIENCMNGLITDSKSIAVTFLALKHLEYKFRKN